jgi:cation diffusion facilitator CzcD-associated flavoprotein CzcO
MSAHPETLIPIAIVGTGFSGLGMAIRLKQHGIDDFVLFERAHEVGGTWRDNSYPGCACDVESHLYSFSFAPNPSWTRMFSPQAEIWDYLRDCVERFGIRARIRFGHEVREATWDDTRKRWRLVTSQGTFTAEVLISATGALSEPKTPKLEGIDRFQGKIMHSARWDHDYDLTGRRVAVIGTGASAIQFVPEIQPRVGRLYVFQRTAPWVVPRVDRRLADWERRLLKAFPLLQRLRRLRIYLFRELLGFAFRRPRIMSSLRKVALRHLARAIRDPKLCAALTPGYTIGCKRILLSNDYYPSLTRENIELVTDVIREVRARSIVTADGKEREVDALLFGTGFQVTEMPCGRFIRGKDGLPLADVWRGSPRAFLGTTVTGFPNLFLLMGPNTGLGHSSVVLMLESQIAHVLGAVRFMRKNAVAALEPRPEAQARFNAEVDEQMRGTVWTSGCSSWYLDRTGRNSTLWPRSVGAFRRRVGRFHPAAYLVTSSATHGGGAEV